MNMYDYVKETPEVLKYIISERKKIFKPLVEKISEKSFDEIVFIGSGTSNNAAVTAKYFIEKVLNVKVRCEFPNLFKNYENILNKNALYIAISQTGQSRLTYEALSKVKEMNLINFSITSDLNSSISKLSDVSLDMSCGEEKVIYRTKGYSSTLIDLYLLALELGLTQGKISDKDYKEYVENLEEISNNFDKLIDISKKWYEDNKQALISRNNIFIIGTGPNLGTAIEGSLKIVETVKCVTNNYELEEYMHGPQNALSDEACMFIIESEDESKTKSQILDKYLKTKISCSYLVGKEGDIKLPCVGNKYFSALELVIPFQVISHCLSIDKGIDLAKKRFPDFDEFVGKKI
ncbi:SIS domain-containing protein [Haloimpatiens sp. FM7330]|uniref:SIS domain-containing protein n=1 Tax=Haloimpatiens sp. FM7330 TaxID=3298610 RepID=UPI003629776A